jgi:hypothetical protein
MTLAATAAAATPLLLVLTHDARADETWKNTSPSPANWGDAANWSGNAVPNSTDHVFFLGNDAATRLITLNVPAAVADLQIANQGGGSYVVNQNSNVSLTVLQDFKAIASQANGHGTHNQSDGVNTYASSLQVGAARSAVGPA